MHGTRWDVFEGAERGCSLVLDKSWSLGENSKHRTQLVTGCGPLGFSTDTTTAGCLNDISEGTECNLSKFVGSGQQWAKGQCSSLGT